jgi:2-dehydropantoate 2-reductase
MRIETVGIVGLGSIGAMYGSIIQKALGPGHVIAIADPERVLRYRDEGIYVNGEKQDFLYAEPKEAQPVDLLIFATKYYSLLDAIENARKACGEETIVMSFLNGVSSEELIREKLGPRHLLYTTVQGMDATKRGNQISVQHTGYVAFGEKDNGRTEILSRVFGL